MRHALASFCAILLLAAGVILVIGVDAAHATCNGGAACSCGSTVDVNTTLSSLTDPVCTTVCPSTGLQVNPGITLDLNGCTLRGTVGVGNGVQGGSGAQIGGGKITGFANGVALSGTLGSVSDVKISGGTGHGITISGNENTVEKAVVSKQGLDCVRVAGNGNLVSHVQALDCQAHGIEVLGNDNRVEQSKALRNVSRGIRVVGNDNTVFSSHAEKSFRGIAVQGDGNTVAQSKARRIDEVGIVFFGNDNTGTSNRIEDNGNGIQAQGERNVLTRNVALRNAQGGLAPAQYRIGNFYEKGLGIDRDIAKAKTWYQMAAEQGNASAMHNLAVLFAMGADGTADNESAARWFQNAAELGVKDSQFNLGILAAKGVGMPQSLEESYKWFALVAKTGDRDAAAKRDEIANALRPEQLEKARAATELWKAKPVNAETNTVTIPDAWRESDAKTASVDMKQAVRNIQTILNKNGYDAGSADGVMGAKTKRRHRRLPEGQRHGCDRRDRREAGAQAAGKEMIRRRGFGGPASGDPSHLMPV